MRTAEQVRQEILSLVNEFYQISHGAESFQPGISRVHYAGRVYDQEEMMAIADSVLDFWLTLGDKDREFVKQFTEFHRVKYGLVTNSGSSANLLAISSLCSKQIDRHLNPGDEVITTASTFPTTLNPILQNLLVPVFVDIEGDTYNIDANKIEQAITSKTRAIVFAHTLGNPADMDAIVGIARKHDLFIVEDTCDGLDSKYDGKLCGTFGDVGTFSFYAAHHITMGEGGAVITNNHSLYRQMLSIRDWGRSCFCQTGEKHPKGACGKRFEQSYLTLPEGYDHKYVYSNIGYNLKPLDIQCAMGIEQLKKLPTFTNIRKRNFQLLFQAMKRYEDVFILPRSLARAEPSWFAFPLTVRENAGFSRKEIVVHLEAKNIETRMLFGGNILKHPGYQGISYRIACELKNTDTVLENTFFLGVYPGLCEQRIQYIINVIDEFIAGRQRGGA